MCDGVSDRAIGIDSKWCSVIVGASSSSSSSIIKRE